MKSILSNIEKQLAVACVTLGGCVSAALASKDSFFFSNFLFFWGSQVLVLAFISMFRPRAAVVAGIAFSLALYLCLFGSWVFTRSHPDSMAWLGYVFSLPGAIVGVLLVASLSQRQPNLGSLAVGLTAAAAVASGIAANQLFVCSTLMYCGGK